MIFRYNEIGHEPQIDWANSLPALVMQANRAINHRLHVLLGPLELTVPETRALAALCQEGPMNQQKLAALLGVSKGNIVQLVDKLSARGLVDRMKSFDDRRENVLGLTAGGQALHDRAMPLIQSWFVQAMASVPEEMRRSCSQTLHLVTIAMRDEKP